jgi:hypothetical protein
MDNSFEKYVNKYFGLIIKKYGFSVNNRSNESQSYFIEYDSYSFTLKIEKYHREFYIILYSKSYPEYEINLFNLLRYLNRDNSEKILPNYFPTETDIDECLRKQLEYLSGVVCENYEKISDFFKDGNYESNFLRLKKFMIEKYPKLFKN